MVTCLSSPIYVGLVVGDIGYPRKPVTCTDRRDVILKSAYNLNTQSHFHTYISFEAFHINVLSKNDRL